MYFILKFSDNLKSRYIYSYILIIIPLNDIFSPDMVQLPNLFKTLVQISNYLKLTLSIIKSIVLFQSLQTDNPAYSALFLHRKSPGNLFPGLILTFHKTKTGLHFSKAAFNRFRHGFHCCCLIFAFTDQFNLCSALNSSCHNV